MGALHPRLRRVHVRTRGLQIARPIRSLAAGTLMALLAVAGCAQSAGAGGVTSTTIAPRLGHVVNPSIRTAQVYVPPGRAPTKGPIGKSPSKSDGLALNILAGLAHDEPIYEGDFADPTALAISNTLYFYASTSSPSKYDHGANVPVIALFRGTGFSGRFLGDAIPNVPYVVGAGLPMGSRRVGAPERHVRPLLLDSRNRATELPRHASRRRVRQNGPGWTTPKCISRATSTSPTGPFVDDSTSAFICPYR